jgi:ATP-dependent helicase/DNAse subunit B
MRGEMESRIWEFVDAIRRGRFEVQPTAPKKTCSYCNYSGMCRYDRFRATARRKGDAGEQNVENR